MNILKLAQSLENKYRLGLDESSSDLQGDAMADDNPYETPKPPSPSFFILLEQMKRTAQKALDNTNHLLYNASIKFRKSVGLLAFQRGLSQLLTNLNNIKDPNAIEIDRIDTILQGLSFFSSPSNVGTGYDPLTNDRDGEVLGPGNYMSNLMELSRQLKNTLEF